MKQILYITFLFLSILSFGQQTYKVTEGELQYIIPGKGIIIKKGDVGINFYDNIAGDSMCGFFVYLPIKNGYSLRIPYQKVDFPLKNKYLELVEKYNNNEILNAKINKEKDGFDIVYPNVNNCHKKHHI